MHEVYNGVNQINDVQWNETVIFCGDFNWFVDFVQMNLLYSMQSRRASWLFGLKMVSKCRAFICLYCTRVSRQVNSYLESVHHRAGIRVPGYISQAYYSLLGIDYVYPNFTHFFYVSCNFVLICHGFDCSRECWSGFFHYCVQHLLMCSLLHQSVIFQECSNLTIYCAIFSR